MTGEWRVAARVAGAREHLRAALALTDPLEGGAVELLCSSLQAAVDALNDARREAAAGLPAALRPSILALRSDAARLRRLVESSAAFCRGIELYAPSGVISRGATEA